MAVAQRFLSPPPLGSSQQNLYRGRRVKNGPGHRQAPPRPLRERDVPPPLQTDRARRESIDLGHRATRSSWVEGSARAGFRERIGAGLPHGPPPAGARCYGSHPEDRESVDARPWGAKYQLCSMHATCMLPLILLLRTSRPLLRIHPVERSRGRPSRAFARRKVGP